MSATQSRAVTGHVIAIVCDQLTRASHGASPAAVGAVLQRLATCSNGEGIVDQSVGQLASALRISEPVIKRVLCAATDVGVLVTLRKGGGPRRQPTQRQMRLDYHQDGQLYLFGETQRPQDLSPESNSDPAASFRDPTPRNTDPLGIHTQEENKEQLSSAVSALSLELQQKAESIEYWLFERQREKHSSHIRNPVAWERTVRQDIKNRYGEKIAALLRVAPDAPCTLIGSCAESGNSMALAPYATSAASSDT